MASALFWVFAAIVTLVVIWIKNPPARRKSPVRSKPFGAADPVDHGTPYRNVESFKELVTSAQGAHTVADLFRQSVERFGSMPAYGRREVVKTEKRVKEFEKAGEKHRIEIHHPYLSDYKFISFNEASTIVRRLGAGLAKLGLQSEDKVGIFAETRMEWHLAAQACFAHNFPVVTAYATLGKEAVAYAFHLTQVRCVITTADLVKTLGDAAKEVKTLEHVICIGKVPEAATHSWQITSWEDLQELGAEETAPVLPPKEDDLAVVMFTSGSTGNPKGVMISHKNLVSTVGAISMSIHPALSTKDCYIGFLPLAHVLELVAELTCITNGTSIGYASPHTLKDDQATDAVSGKPMGDISALRPTVMASVPAILDKLRGAVEKKVSGGGFVLRNLFHIAYFFKQRDYLQGKPSPVWDAIVFRKVAKSFGGRLRAALCGGAPLSPETQEFMNICFCCPVIQGYGLTETCGATCVTHTEDVTVSNVGAPVPCCEVKLADVAEMGYLNSDVDPETKQAMPRGEICIRGASVTLGYYENEQATNEAYVKDSEGGVWFRTGDIGTWLPDGTLRIIDRKKDLVKLAMGEYVALGKVEAAMRDSPFVANVALHAEPSQYATVAIVLPEHDELRKFAAQANIPDANQLDKLCENAQVKERVLQDIKAVCKKAGLHAFEIPAKVHIAHEEWTAAEGLLTEAMKIKRYNIFKKYKPQLDALYASMAPPA